MDLGVIVRRPEDAVIEFTLGASPRQLSGTAQLLQSVVIELMSDPLPALGRGSGFVSALRGHPTDDRSTVQALAARALDTAKTHILQYQANDRGLRDSERLLDIALRRLYSDGLRWYADLLLRSVSGTRTVFTAA